MKYSYPVVLLALLNLAGLAIFSNTILSHSKYESGRDLSVDLVLDTQKLVGNVLLLARERPPERKVREQKALRDDVANWRVRNDNLVLKVLQTGLEDLDSGNAAGIATGSAGSYEELRTILGLIGSLSPAELEDFTTDSPLLHRLMAETDRYLKDVNRTSHRFEQAEASNTRLLFQMVLGIVVVLFLLLVFVVLFIIRPMVRRIQHDYQKLRHVNEELQREVAQHQRTEMALRENELQIRTILHANVDGIMTIDDKGDVETFNPAAERIFGYRAEEVVGRPIPLLLPLEKTRSSRVMSEDVSERFSLWVGSGAIEVMGRRKDGSQVPQEITVSEVSSQGRRKFTAIIRDITERKRAEEELRRLATAVDQATESIVITDTGGHIQYVNPAFLRTTGYDREEVLGRNPRVLKSGRHNDDFYRSLWETISQGRVWSGRMVNRKKDGTVYEEDQTISPIWDGAGRIINYIGIRRDVTELVQMEAQLRQSQKLEAIGAMAGGIAHDFNNILTPILGYTELVQAGLGKNNGAHRDLARVRKAAIRARDLIAQIMIFSRQAPSHVQPVQVDSLVKEVLKLMRSTLPATITICEDIASALSPVRADPTQMYTLLMNLCINASQAMPDGGELAVSLAEVDLEAFEAPPAGTISGRFTRLEVTDTGIGMTPATLAHIFEPFFTTKEVGKGTGLGLSTVYGIVKQHGGAIRVSSRPGHGATFQVFLPTVAEATEESGVTRIPQRGDNESILFVDDEEDITALGKRMLEDLGYRVLAMSNSSEALRCFSGQPDRFDLVVTDQTMPGLTGLKLAEQLRRIRPDIPIILSTGFHDSAPSDRFPEVGICRVLAKPFSREELGRIVAEVLRGDGRAV